MQVAIDALRREKRHFTINSELAHADLNKSDFQSMRLKVL